MSLKVKRRKPPNANGPGVLGIAWYRPWEWERLRELAADPDAMNQTHSGWLQAANERLADLRRMGFMAVRVDIDVEELAAWCRQKGLPLTGQARSRFTAEKVRKGNTSKTTI